MNPQKRSDNIVVEEVFDEIVVADMERDKAHHLNPMAAFVWQQCDGQKTPQQIATLVQLKFQIEKAEELVWMSLERLSQANLLAEQVAQDRGILSRREMLKLAGKAGIAVTLLPVVASITAPRAAAAGTCSCGSCITSLSSCGGCIDTSGNCYTAKSNCTGMRTSNVTCGNCFSSGGGMSWQC